MAQSSIAASADGVTRRYGDRAALSDFTFSIGKGEVVGLLGHNGAGKTTTIRLLTGLITPDAGSMRVLDMDPVTQGAEIRARTGVLTENPALDNRLTGRENLAYFTDYFGIEPETARRRIEFLIDAFDLEAHEQDRVSTYSKGMHQRLALARAMLHEPEILLLDEPTSGLDPVAARVVHLMINAFRSDGGSVLLCTHNLEEAGRLCDRIVVLEHGRVIATGIPRDLIARVADQQVEMEISPEFRDQARTAVMTVAPNATLAIRDNVLRMDGVPRARIPDLVDALAAAGVPLYRLTPRVSTLEDVYFALHENGHNQ